MKKEKTEMGELVVKFLNQKQFESYSKRSKKGWETKKRKQKLDDLNKILNWYKDMNDKNECYYDDYGEWRNVSEEYDCLSFEETITECIGMRKDIQKIKELVKEIC